MSSIDSLISSIKYDAIKPLNQIALVIGAGVSIGATNGAKFASWHGLIASGIDRVENRHLWNSDDDKNSAVAEEYRKNARSFFVNNEGSFDEILNISQKIIRCLRRGSEPDLKEWLSDTIGSLSGLVEFREDLDLIALLAAAGATIITTNYDDLLSNACNKEVITWRDSDSDLANAVKDKSKIIHIHGHWRDPKSLVFGKDSYKNITESDAVQIVLRSVWLQKKMIFIGCGAGVRDPNIGAMLKFMNATFPEVDPDNRHYFLGSSSDVEELQNTELINSIHFKSYTTDNSDHAELTKILARFLLNLDYVGIQRVGADSVEESLSRPGWGDFLNQEIPDLSCEALINVELETKGYAVISGGHETGKTTAALKIAAREFSDNSYIIDLADVDSIASPLSTAHRVAMIQSAIGHRGNFLIIDNCHHDPIFAKKFWEKCGSSRLKLKVVYIFNVHSRRATSYVSPSPYLLSNPEITVINYHVDREDFISIVKYLVRRNCDTELNSRPLSSSSEQWQTNFNCALAAFTLAVKQNLHKFTEGAGPVELDLDNAVGYFKEHRLDKLDVQVVENLVCIALFSSQELELQTPKDVLPYPNYVNELKTSELVKEFVAGKSYSHSKMFKLHEPGWGRLIIGAVKSSVNLFDFVGKDAALVRSVIGRWLKQDLTDQVGLVWDSILENPNDFLRSIDERALSVTDNLLNYAEGTKRHDAAILIYNHLLNSKPFQSKVPRAYPHNLVSFMNTVEKLEVSETTLENQLSTLFIKCIEEEFSSTVETLLTSPLSQSRVMLQYLEARNQHETVQNILKGIIGASGRFNENAMSGNGNISEIAQFLSPKFGLRDNDRLLTVKNNLQNYILENPESEANLALTSPIDAISTYMTLLENSQAINFTEVASAVNYPSLCHGFVHRLFVRPAKLAPLLSQTRPDYFVNFVEKVKKFDSIEVTHSESLVRLYHMVLEMDDYHLLSFKLAQITKIIEFALAKDQCMLSKIYTNIDNDLRIGMTFSSNDPIHQKDHFCEILSKSGRQDLANLIV